MRGTESFNVDSLVATYKRMKDVKGTKSAADFQVGKQDKEPKHKRTPVILEKFGDPAFAKRICSYQRTHRLTTSHSE